MVGCVEKTEYKIYKSFPHSYFNQKLRHEDLHVNGFFSVPNLGFGMYYNADCVSTYSKL